MDAVVLAGGADNPQDPLYELAPNGIKALLPIGGKPMLQWVLDALLDTGRFDKIIIMGTGIKHAITPHPAYVYLEPQGGIVKNILAGSDYLLHQLKRDPNEIFISVSADVPAISAEMINWLIDAVAPADHDFYYATIERKVMEAKFPTSKRTYLRLKDAEVCGSDINAIRLSLPARQGAMAERLTSHRKSVLKQAAMLGFDNLLLVLFKLVTLDQAAIRISSRLGFRGKALSCPYAEMGMDVDKPFQYQIVKDYMER